MDPMGEGCEESFEARGDTMGIALPDDIDMDEAGGAVDGDEHISALGLQAGEMLEVDMDEAAGCVIGEAAAGARLGCGLGFLGHADTLHAAVDGAAREGGIDAPLHDLDDVVEAQADILPQFANERFIGRRGALSQPMPGVRSVGDAISGFPSPHGGFADTELAGQLRHGQRARLDQSPRLGRGSGISVQVDLHDILAWQDGAIQQPLQTTLYKQTG